MVVTPQESARELLDVVPMVMREIRFEMRSRRSPELTVPQFRTLAFVNRKEGPSLSEVADHMGLTPPSTCRLVDGLVARGMMTREDYPTDRRRVRLAVTRRGLKILEASRSGTLACLAEKLDGVAADDRAVIVKAMEVLRSIFTTDKQAKTAQK